MRVMLILALWAAALVFGLAASFSLDAHGMTIRGALLLIGSFGCSLSGISYTLSLIARGK